MLFNNLEGLQVLTFLKVVLKNCYLLEKCDGYSIEELFN